MKVPKSPSYKLFKPTSEHASKVGKGNRKHDTKPELLLRRCLWSLKLRYRVHYGKLPGNPDIVFPGQQIAIFCDGDFWHGRNWSVRKEKLAKGANSEYWIAKIERNIQRDQEINTELRSMGWTVLRTWESDIKKDPTKFAQMVALVVRSKDKL